MKTINDLTDNCIIDLYITHIDRNYSKSIEAMKRGLKRLINKENLSFKDLEVTQHSIYIKYK